MAPKTPESKARALANLRPAPPAPAGNSRALKAGYRSELLLRDIEAEVRELMDALAEAVPARESDGTVPAADVTAIEAAARALKRWRHISTYLDLHGRLDPKGNVRAAARYELEAERELRSCLDALGCSPMSRSRLGLNIVNAMTAGERWTRHLRENYGGQDDDGEDEP